LDDEVPSRHRQRNRLHLDLGRLRVSDSGQSREDFRTKCEGPEPLRGKGRWVFRLTLRIGHSFSHLESRFSSPEACCTDEAAREFGR
jgi:hypothetical protein